MFPGTIKEYGCRDVEGTGKKLSYLAESGEFFISYITDGSSSEDVRYVLRADIVEEEIVIEGPEDIDGDGNVSFRGVITDSIVNPGRPNEVLIIVSVR